MIAVYFLSLALFVILFTREVIAPASGAQCDKRWRIYAGTLNAVNIAVAVAAGIVFRDWIAVHSLLSLPPTTGALSQSLVTFLLASFLAYWWHRLTHASDLLWRCIHQLHHSPSRIEALTAFYVHPLDSFLAASLNALIAYVILGVSVPAAALALLYVAIFNLIAHADMRTPWVLGFITQRPEMHRLHHEHRSHTNNFGLPLWDLLFGTWRNPRHGKVLCGFEPKNEYRVKDMLLMRKVGD